MFFGPEKATLPFSDKNFFIAASLLGQFLMNFQSLVEFSYQKDFMKLEKEENLRKTCIQAVKTGIIRKSNYV